MKPLEVFEKEFGEQQPRYKATDLVNLRDYYK